MNAITHIYTENSDNGFTLVEVLVAMVIFAIGVMAVAQLQSQAQLANKRAFEQTEATMWASNQAETIIGLDYNDATLAQGTYDTPAFLDPRNKYGLTWIINDDADERKSIQLTVTWDSYSGEKNLTFDYVKSNEI